MTKISSWSNKPIIGRRAISRNVLASVVLVVRRILMAPCRRVLRPPRLEKVARQLPVSARRSSFRRTYRARWQPWESFLVLSSLGLIRRRCAELYERGRERWPKAPIREGWVADADDMLVRFGDTLDMVSCSLLASRLGFCSASRNSDLILTDQEPYEVRC